MFIQAFRPFRVVFQWQMLITAALTAVAGYFAGRHGAVSAALGGSIGIVAGLAFVGAAALSKGNNPSSVLAAALRAEAIKVGVIIALLWLVLASYADIVAVAFIATFAVSVVIFSLAGFARVHRITTN